MSALPPKADMCIAKANVCFGPKADILVTALKRAVTNLLENAVKYGKRAEVAIANTAKGIEITVDDEGPGIPEAELSRVVQPFYRVEGSRNRDTGGVGLGLAIAQAVVQAQGGELTLSNRPSGGLHACIRLPA